MRSYLYTSDRELLELLGDDENTQAFEEIYNRYWDKLYGAAYKRLRSTETAEEIVQDLFTDIWERRKVLNIATELPIYLFSAVRYRVINHIHKEAIKNKYVSARLELPEYDNSTEEVVIANDMYDCLQRKVQSLPIKCREVFELSRKEHQSNKQIANKLGISEKTVENQITKALKRLRTSLNSLLFIF